MIISAHFERRSRRGSHLLVLACAFLFVSLGAVQAQKPDYKAVGKRLQAAVEAGELTGQQARMMLGALKKAPATQQRGAVRAKVYLTRVKKQLAAAVKAGKISKEDAAKRYASAAERIKKRMAAGQKAKKASQPEKRKSSSDAGREYLAKVREKLGAAVRSGKMSREDAGKKYAEAKRAVKKKMALAKKKDAKSVSSRKKDVRAKAARVSKASAHEPDSLRQVELDLGNIQKALKSGKLSIKNAELKMRDLRRRLAVLERAGRQQGRRRR